MQHTTSAKGAAAREIDLNGLSRVWEKAASKRAESEKTQDKGIAGTGNPFVLSFFAFPSESGLAEGNALCSMFNAKCSIISLTSHPSPLTPEKHRPMGNGKVRF
jgi:hypothetical protein